MPSLPRTTPTPPTTPKRRTRGALGAFALLAALAAALDAGGAAGHEAEPAAAQRPPELAGSIVRVTLRVQDPAGRALRARARAQNGSGVSYPVWMDTTLLSHGLGGTFFYVDSAATFKVLAGSLHLTLGRGFETMPFDGWFTVLGDTTLTVTLFPFTDLRPLGWYGGEMHSHSAHPPMDYPALTPARSRMVQNAEAISVLHVLDQDRFFTGAPHALSDSLGILYYSYESRNQTYGHAVMAGLTAPSYPVCCLDPAPPFPMLTDLHRSIAGTGAMMILGHPHTTDNFYYDSDWPGAGLGRELPVLAATGEMDALDVMSASNHPNADWIEWYDLLSSGLAVVPSAGSDAVLNRYFAPPPGGFRVYARLEPGQPFGYAAWLNALRAGRTFVTSYPLVPEFSVGGKVPGETLETEGATLTVPVHLRAECAIGLTRVAVMADGEEAWARPFEEVPLPTVYDTTLALTLPTPAWMALHVLGPSFHPHAPFYPAEAHTNAIRMTRLGAPLRRTLACGLWMDRLTELEGYADARGNWSAAWQSDSVRIRIDRARAFFRSAFVLPPSPFQLLFPAPEESTLASFGWEAKGDPELGDMVKFVLRVSADSTLAGAWVDSTRSTWRGMSDLPPEHWYWWSVDAVDRAGNVRSAETRRFYLRDEVLGVGTAPAAEAPRASPNPSRGPVALTGFTQPPAIFDLAGRRVAGAGDLRRAGAGWVWDGTDRGRSARPGIYLVRSADGRRHLHIVRLR